MYETPPETHNPLEPHATLAVWNGDRLTVYDATQGIFGVRKKLAIALALPPGNVRVITKFVGGGFGCKGSAWSHVVIAALAAKQLGRPVKIALTRPQMFGMVGGRPHTRQTVAAAAEPGGKLTALRHESVSTTSRFDDFLEPAALVSRHQYKCANVETKHRLVRLDIGTPTYMRAPGESSGSFALESAIDELSHQLGIDPIELPADQLRGGRSDRGEALLQQVAAALLRDGRAALRLAEAHPRPRGEAPRRQAGRNGDGDRLRIRPTSPRRKRWRG